MELFNETLMDIFSNFIPNKKKKFRDSDPTWMNDDFKSKIKLKHKLYHRYLRLKRNNEDKIVVNKSPNYLYNYVSTVNQSYQTRSGGNVLHICCRTEYFVNSFFPYTIKEWNNLSPEIRKSVSYEVFKN